MWAANALKTPDQHLIVQSIAMAGDQLPPENSIDMIAANRKGMDYSKISDERDVNDTNLKAQIASSLSDQTKFLVTQYGAADGIKLQNSMLSSSLNFVKYQAAKNNDLTLDHAQKYIDQAATFYKQAYPVQSGTNYAFNPNQVNLTKTQADTLANYAIAQGRLKIQADISPEQYERVKFRGGNNLSVTISPTNHIIAQDSNGKIYYDKPYSLKLLADANQQEIQDTKRANEETQSLVSDELARSVF